MRCDKAQEIFSDNLEGTIERPMAIAFESHLAECPQCARDYSTFKTTWEMLETLPAVEPPPGFATDVIMAIEMQREAARRAQPRWQAIWNNMFTTKVPARVFAAAVTVFLCSMVLLHTPLRGIVPAWVIPSPADTSNTVVGGPMSWESSPWLNNALSFELAGSRDISNQSIFRLLLKPKDVTSQRVQVYLMTSGKQGFDNASINKSSLIFDDNIGASGRVIPFVLGRANGRQDVMTALVQWNYRKRHYQEAVFVPVQIAPDGKPVTSTVQYKNTELYSALQQLSATYGVVVLAPADVSAVVHDVNLKNCSADDALYGITKDVGLRWRPLLGQVYIVERKIE
jgi:hypothetical protein